MAPRKPKTIGPAAAADPVEQCSPGASDLASILKSLLQLDFDDGSAEEVLQLLGSIAASLSRYAHDSGIWEVARKHRLDIALSKICNWALAQAAEPKGCHIAILLAGHAETILALVSMVSMEQQAASEQQGSCNDDSTAAGWLVKELLRQEVPCKLLRTSLAEHDYAETISQSQEPPPLGREAVPTASDTGTDSLKAWALETAASVTAFAQECIVSKYHGREASLQLIRWANCTHLHSRSPRHNPARLYTFNTYLPIPMQGPRICTILGPSQSPVFCQCAVRAEAW